MNKDKVVAKIGMLKARDCVIRWEMLRDPDVLWSVTYCVTTDNTMIASVFFLPFAFLVRRYRNLVKPSCYYCVYSYLRERRARLVLR